jgi:thiol:disulfide interchange protein DsbD
MLALSMFGFYELQVPAALQTKLAGFHRAARPSGKLAGVFVMGAMSALIVGPCVAAPLAGALVYISQTRDVLVGGAALFSMAVGMSIPLLLVGVSAGSLLPRAGAWMESVKRFFGVLMLAWRCGWCRRCCRPGCRWCCGQRCCSATAPGCWAGAGTGWRMAFGAAFGILGAVQLAALASGGRDPLAPLAHLTGATIKSRALRAPGEDVAELDAALAANQRQDRHARFLRRLVRVLQGDGKADLHRSGVQAQAGHTVLLQVDVTANDATTRRC